MRNITTIIVLFLFSFHVQDAYPLGQFYRPYNRKEIKKQIAEIGDMDYGQEFLNSYSAEDLEHVVLFLQDPVRHFKEIQRISNIWPYIWTYQRYIRETIAPGNDIWGPFLEMHFRCVDEKKVPILTFLYLVAPPGASKELFADTYIDLFNFKPDVFIKHLKKQNDWKGFIGELLGLERSWTMGINKLGNSDFEREFKAYIIEHRIKS